MSSEVIDLYKNSHTKTAICGESKMEELRISREIEIDLAHRITNHKGKCKNIHGHRYKIVVHCEGKILPEGTQNPQEGMLVDFSFLKDIMIQNIDRYFDHATCLWRQDPLVLATLTREELDASNKDFEDRGFYFKEPQAFWGKINVVPFIPTAENMAKFFAELLDPYVRRSSNGRAQICQVDIWETPSCCASYEVA